MPLSACCSTEHGDVLPFEGESYFFRALQNRKIPRATIATPRSRSVLGSGAAILSSAIAGNGKTVRIIVVIERIFLIVFRYQ